MQDTPPNYILSKCIDHLNKFLITKEEQLPYQQFIRCIGFNKDSGAACSTVASMKKYGIVEGDRTIKPTNLGTRCCNNEIEALTTAVFNPPLFKNLWAKKIPVDKLTIVARLLNKGLSPFTSFSATIAASCYCRNFKWLCYVISESGTPLHPEEFIFNVLQQSPTPPAQSSGATPDSHQPPAP